MSTSTARSSGAVRIVPRASSWNTRRPNRSRMCAGSWGRPRSRPATSRRASICLACPRASASSIARHFRVSSDLSISSEADHRNVHDSAGARSAAGRDARVDRRHGRPGMGHQRRDGRHAPLRDDANGRGRRLHPHRRHHLRRWAAPVRGETGRRSRVAEPRDAREEQGGGDARRVPRQPPLQPARRERPAVQRVACRSSRSGTTTKYSTTGIPPRSSPARVPSPSGASRCSPRARKRAFMEYTPTRPDPADPERIYRACRFGPLVEIFGFDMRSYRGAKHRRNRESTPSDESALLGARAGRVAEAPAAGVIGDVEDHRQRHAARPRGARTAPRSRRSPTATPGRRSAASSRSRAC